MTEESDPDKPVVRIETLAYDVKVYGTENDELDDVVEAATELCERAMDDAQVIEDYNNSSSMSR